MEKTVLQMMVTSERQHDDFRHYCVGRILCLTEKGEPMVTFVGSMLGPILARTLVSMSCQELNKRSCMPVLLLFENGDPALPIIVGFVRDAIEEHPTSSSRMHTIEADGKRLLLDAKEEILLRCGKGSILLRKDGKVVIKGTNIINRSTGKNKIKGASVAIN